MAVEKPQPVSPPLFQPRLAPKPALPDGFRRALADQMDARPGTSLDTAPAASSPLPRFVRLETGPLGHQVRGVVDPSAFQGGDAVRGVVASGVPAAPAQAGIVRGTVVWPDASGGAAGSAARAAVLPAPSPMAALAPENTAEPATAPVSGGTPEHQATFPAPTPMAAQAAEGAAGTVTAQAAGSLSDPPAKPPGPLPQAAPPAPAFSPDDEAALLAWAAAVKQTSRIRKPAPAKPPPLPREPEAQPPLAVASDALAATATAQLGRRYAEGGQSPRQGFDCSGLTSYVYGRSGIDLLRSSREQFHQGVPVKREDLRTGDLVFFGKKGVHHVGIYMGNGSFLHATVGGRVKTDSLDNPLWARDFAGARRIVGSDAGLSLGKASGMIG